MKLSLAPFVHKGMEIYTKDGIPGVVVCVYTTGTADPDILVCFNNQAVKRGLQSSFTDIELAHPEVFDPEPEQRIKVKDVSAVNLAEEITALNSEGFDRHIIVPMHDGDLKVIAYNY